MKIRILSILFILLFLTGCSGTFEIGLEPSGASANNPVATATTAPLLTNTPLALPTAIPQLTTEQPTELYVAPTDTPATQFVQVYLIALEDNGQTGIPVGCGDSAVPVQVQIQYTQGVLKAALEALLSIKEQYYGQSGLYNALYQADLQVDSVNITDGKAIVNLSGSLNLGGECDNPRVQAQLEQTVLQFSTVTEADIFINGKSLADAISLKGQ
jgi:hypothetical protein